MSSYSEEKYDGQVGPDLDGPGESAFYSEADGCDVVLCRCAKCGGEYEEELTASKVLTQNHMDLLCIKCDPGGDEWSLGVIILSGCKVAFFRGEGG